ncbi:MAG: uncharacterized protein KVP18_002177 [Porospora cf. gigantea A]|uniref:uncharacterized protein n=1 Tax=Porospora cf. gigantea A TaxID=2853593 RepID=UPI00355A5212|nr:MAG: hypothetical protein KVP18_002177 [Porospora cf. gigantea A]
MDLSVDSPLDYPPDATEATTVSVKWNKDTLRIPFSPVEYSTSTVAELKALIEVHSTVPMDRQKLLGLHRLVKDDCLLSDLPFKKLNHVVLVGTALKDKWIDLEDLDDIPEVYNDFDYDENQTEVLLSDPLHAKRLRLATQKTQVSIISPPRSNKKLLVLDLDYTLFDHKHLALGPRSKRPHLDEFLAAVYLHYDIAVWSQTPWRWVELKCTELGMLTSPHFKICFTLDRTSMFTICSRTTKRHRLHEVKALQVIWSHFQQWGPHNTLHVDDVKRNFALNPLNGVPITPFKLKKQHTIDNELSFLARYLEEIADVTDVREADHRRWRERFG